jgi:Protein of unknown function (DUF3168)
VARLRGDAALTTLLGGAKIYESVPASTAAPWVTFGEMSSRDNGTSSDSGSEHRIALICTSLQPGFKEALTIAERVEALLLSPPLNPAGHRLVNILVTGIDMRRAEKSLSRSAVLRLRAVTEVI